MECYDACKKRCIMTLKKYSSIMNEEYDDIERVQSKLTDAVDKSFKSLELYNSIMDKYQKELEIDYDKALENMSYAVRGSNWISGSHRNVIS